MRYRSVRSVVAAAGIGFAVCGGGASALGGEAPQRTEAGLTLVVPAEMAAKGTVYYVIPGQDVQVTFSSDAPLEKITGTSGAVVGFAVVAKDVVEGKSPLVGGAFRLPVASLDTGIPTRNGHPRSADWMDANSFPDVVFQITEVKDCKVAKKDEAKGFTTYDATLVGDIAIHGVTKSVSIPARFTMMPAGDNTKARGRGDLFAIRCKYPVKLSDYGVGVGMKQIMGVRMADDVEVDEFLLLTNVSPETRLKPAEGKPDEGAAQLTKFRDLLVRRKDADAAYAYGRQLMKERGDDAMFLNQLANFAMSDDASRRDLRFAREAAQRAAEKASDKDAATIYDTVAEVYYKAGDLEKAIEWQQKAVEKLPADAPPELAKAVKGTLKKYEGEKGG